MNFWSCRLILLLLALAPGLAQAGTVSLTTDGKGLATIYVPPAVMEANHDTTGKKWWDEEAETQRQRLRESVKDLAKYIGAMSGARVEVVQSTDVPAVAGPGSAEPVQVLVGDLAAKAYGPPAKPFPYKQGFRLVVDPKAQRVAVAGESDLATSYAVYEILDRLGCRWYMPGEMGEVIPQLKTIALEETDFSSHPATIYRGIWYADDAYRRRNRHGGLRLSAGHALEINGAYLSEEDKKAHPEWIGTIGGQPAPSRLKWSNAAVADFIGDKIVALHERDPRPSYSLSPDDGYNFDDSPEDRALDANDFDATTQTTSITDRMMVIDNRIINRVTAKHPEALFGVLAYVQFTRPPVREKVPKNLVPQIAPITYSRAHPIDDDRVPGNKDLRYIIEGWGKRASAGTSLYFYGWFLAEATAPFPMIRRWSHDVPYVLEKGNCKYWQPETTANFDTSMHGLYLGCRLAWDSTLKPDEVIKELNDRFYGSAATEMTAYWDFVDRVWTETPEYSGGPWGHLRRWTPENLHKARGTMNAALASARTPAERYRVGLADESLSLFEEFMRMRYDLVEGRFARLDDRGEAWKKRIVALGEKYKDCYAFTRVFWAPETIAGGYFKSMHERAYREAATIAKEGTLLTDPPIRRWKYIADPENKGESAGYAKVDYDDAAWRTTDACAETWSTLGYHDYFGPMWYRTDVSLPAVAAAGKKTFLWISTADSTAKLFVNDRHIRMTKRNGEGKLETQDVSNGYCIPFTADVTDALNPSGRNEIAILTTRSKAEFNELGSGGLIGPVIVYRER